jgi:hypothetical protein
MPESRTPEQIEADIAAQRERLAQTVDQLSAKLDVKSRTQARLAGVKDRATTVEGTPRPEVIAAAGSLVAMIAVLLIWRLRRQH